MCRLEEKLRKTSEPTRAHIEEPRRNEKNFRNEERIIQEEECERI